MKYAILCVALAGCVPAKVALAGTVVAAAGDITCIAECSKGPATAATDVGFAALGVVGAVAALGFVLYEITKNDGPRN